MNNSFTNCIDKICGLELSNLTSYKYSIFGGNTAVVEGHKGISTYGESQIVFHLKCGKLTILGCKLALKCLNADFAVVVGQISAVEVTK